MEAYIKVLFVIIIQVIEVTPKLTVQPNNEGFTEDLKMYSYRSFTNVWNGRATYCNIMTFAENTNECTDIFVKSYNEVQCVKTVWHNYTAEYIAETATTLTVIVSTSFMKLKEVLNIFTSSNYYDNKGKYIFIVCGSTENLQMILEISEVIWKKKILDFTFIYNDRGSLKGCRFNPANDKLAIMDMNQTNFQGVQSSEKFGNFRGYPLKILVIPSFLDNYLYKTFDDLFQLFLHRIVNVTLQAVIIPKDYSTIKNIIKMIATKDIEICPFTQPLRFLTAYNNMVQMTYPHMSNNLIALVPKPKRIKKWKQFLDLLYSLFVPFYFIPNIIISLVNKYIPFNKRNNQFHFFGFLALQLRSPLPGFRKKSMLKLFWLVWCVFNGMLCDFKFLKLMLVPYYESTITTLQELEQTELKIYATEKLVYPPKITTLPKLTWKNKIFKNKGDAVYIGAEEALDKFMKAHANKNMVFNFQTLEQVVFPAYGAYIYKHKSPFSRIFHKIALMVREFGTSDRIPYRFKREAIRDIHKTISFEDLQGVILIWLCGIWASSVVFVCENIIFRIKNMV